MRGMLLEEAGSLLGYDSPAEAGGQAVGQVTTAGYQNLEQREIRRRFLEAGYLLASLSLSSRVQEEEAWQGWEGRRGTEYPPLQEDLIQPGPWMQGGSRER